MVSASVSVISSAMIRCACVVLIGNARDRLCRVVGFAMVFFLMRFTVGLSMLLSLPMLSKLCEERQTVDQELVHVRKKGAHRAD